MKKCFLIGNDLFLMVFGILVLLFVSACATAGKPADAISSDALTPDKNAAQKIVAAEKASDLIRENKENVIEMYNSVINAGDIIDGIRAGKDILIKNCTVEGVIDFTLLESRTSNEYLKGLEENNPKSRHIRSVQRNLKSKKLNVVTVKSSIEISADSIIKDGIKCNGDDEIFVVVFEKKFDLYDSAIEKNADFKNALFMGEAWFNKSRFKKKAYFRHAQFMDFVTFKDSEFFFKPDFNDTQLNGPLHRSAFIVKDAITLKKKNLDPRFIIDHLHEKHADEPVKFGRVDLEANEIVELYDAGFDEDFVRRMQGIPSIVTITPAAIYLERSESIVGALMLGLSIFPKSFWEYGYRNFNLNLGTSSSTQEKKEQSTTNEKAKTEFYLIGISYRLNRYALINLGMAVPDTDEDIQIENQLYVGITVDKDLLELFK